MAGTKVRYVVLAGLFVVAVTAGMAGYTVFKPATAEQEEAAAAMGQPQAMPVPAERVAQQPVRLWKTFSANLEAVHYAEIRPQVSGVVTDIRFEDGDFVKKGAVLYVIDPRPFRAAVNQAKADLLAAQNQADLAQKELDRAEELIKTTAISQRIYDERLSAARVANATVEATRARLETAQINLDYAYVKAPISGQVSRDEVKIGNLVQAGPNAPVLTSVVSNKGIYADFEIDEQTYLNTLRLQQDGAGDKFPVVLTLAATDEEYRGHIHSFDNRLDPATGTIRARAFFSNDDKRLLPGMFATVKMGAADEQDRILVGERAIGTDQDRKFVYVIGEDNTAAYRPVEIGDSIEGRRLILSGLRSGETIIADGIIRVRPGMPVMPQFEDDLQNTDMPPPDASDTQEATDMSGENEA